MSKLQRSIDGFVIRPTQVDAGEKPSPPLQKDVFNERPLQPPEPQVTPLRDALAEQAYKSVSLTDINSSISELNAPGSKLKKRSRLRRSLTWISSLIFVGALGVGGWIAFTAYHTTSSIFTGNIAAALISPDKPLKADQNGNTNILLLGTSESDPGHPGAQLTDSMMMVSVNNTSHKVFLLSIPRDLWVKYDKPCSAGYSGKINAVYECTLGSNLGGLSQAQTDEATAETATASKVGSVIGADIQYVVHMNLSVVQKVVDAVGGIDITIDSPDPRGILDRNFDWRCNYKCDLVKYPNGPAHLTGTNAMWLVQARNDAGGYGLPRSNFDREANQRKVVTATKDKAMSAGFLANPLNIVNLLNALGGNIHTTIDGSEIKSFVDIIKNTPNSNITSIDIQDDGASVLTTAVGPDGSDIVRPVAGLTDYTNLQAFTHQLLTGQASLIAEQATVTVLNGSGTSSAAKSLTSKLVESGIVKAGNGGSAKAAASVPATTIYDLSNGKKPETLTKLKSLLGTQSVSQSLPTGMTATGDFVIVIGTDSNAGSSTATQ